MVDFSNLAALAAAANPQSGGASSASGMSPDMVQQLLSGGYDPSALTGMSSGADPLTSLAQTQLSPGNAKRTASLNVPLPAPPPQGPPPTPNAQVPQGPPPTPNAPQGVPQQPPQRDPLISQMIDPSRVMHPVAGTLGAMGRYGDDQAVHARTGEQMVPKGLMDAHPELRDVLNRAFAAHGMSRQAHQVGHPAGSVNPATGMQEGFSILDLLPMIAGAAGSMFLGPEVLAPALAGTLGPATAGFVAPVLAGTALAGGTAEAMHPERGILNNVGGAALSSLGGQLASSAFSGAAAGAGANAAAGAGANAAANTPVGNPLAGYAAGTGAGSGTLTNLATGEVFAPGAGSFTNLASGEVANTLPGMTPAAAKIAAAAMPGADSPGFFSKLMEHPMDTLMPHGPLAAGAGLLGGWAGSMLGDQLFPAKDAKKTADASDTGSANPHLSLEAQQEIERLTRRTLNPFPSNQYLQTYGASPATPPVRFFG